MNYCIYILSYNHPDLTERCVLSCLNFHQNITLIHNGSTIENQSRLKEKFPQIKHLKLNKNTGFTGGTNAAVSDFLNSQFPQWFVFVTNDCEILKFSALPGEAGLYAPLIMKRKTDQVDSFGGGINTETLSLFHIKSKIHDYKKFYVPGTAWLIDRSSLEKAPLFLESLNTYWEDVLFSHQCQKLGILLGQHEALSLRHGIGKTCHKDPHYTSYLYRRNRWLVLKRILNLSLKQKFKMIIQDLWFCARLVSKGQTAKAKLAFKALSEGYLMNQLSKPRI